MSSEDQYKSLEDSSAEKYIEYWKLIDIIGNASFSIGITFIGLAYFYLNNYIRDFRILIIVPAIMCILTILRNIILTEILTRKSSYFFFNLVQVITRVFYLLFVMLIIILIDLATIQIFVINTDSIFLSISFLYLPIFIMFNGSLTEWGEIKIEFEQATIHINNWTFRQRWIKKIFSRLVEKIKLGYLEIPRDTIISNINRKNSDEILTFLMKIEEWMLGETQDNSILDTIETIIDKDQIKTVSTIPITSRLLKIPPEYVKYIGWILIALAIIFWRPEWAEIIISNIPK